MIARTPPPPYYAVIFTSLRTDDDDADPIRTGTVTFFNDSKGYGVGITVSYWRDLASIRAWKANAAHLVAQRTGRSTWYTDYRTRIAKVERDYGLDDGFDRLR